MGFNYLYICPLFLITAISVPKLLGEIAKIKLKLLSNSKIYDTCIFHKEIYFFCAPVINLRTHRSSTSGKLLKLNKYA